MALFARKNKNERQTPTITQTIAVSLKKNRIKESPHKKKTTFLELFFDLAIVFVFTTLSSRFADYMGISPKIFMGENESIRVTHGEIGLLYWVINFVALWQIWYRYGVLFRNYGNEGVFSHLLTFALILGIGMQAITLTVDSDFFNKYGLLMSFAISKGLLYLFEISIIVSYVRRGHLKKENLRKILYETIAVSVFGLLFVLYFVLEQNGIIAPIHEGGTVDNWRIELIIFAIISITVLVDLLVSIIFHTQTVQMNEMTIYAHTKERHHLLVIIALGESVLFNIGKGVMNDADLVKMIPDLILNLLIIMALWYMYKTYVYRMSYAKGSRNVTIFGVIHVFIIAGMMLMFSSLEAYAEAQAEYTHLHHIQETLPSHPTFVAIEDLHHAMNITYPTIYMFGFGIFMISIIAMMWMIDYGNEEYDKAVKMKKFKTSLIHFLILVAIAIIWSTLMLHAELQLTYIFIMMIGLLFIEFIIGVYLTNKNMIIIAGSEEKAVKELEHLEK